MKPSSAMLVAVALLAGCASPVTEDRRLSESVFVIRSALHWRLPGSALKPDILNRSKLIAESNAFTSFAIESVRVQYAFDCDCFRGEANVRFGKTPVQTENSSAYNVTSNRIRTFGQALADSEAKSVAKILGTSRTSEDGIIVRIEPSFVDAVAGARRGLFGMVEAELLPGKHLVGATVLARRSAFSNPNQFLVFIDVDLAPGASYLRAPS